MQDQPNNLVPPANQTSPTEVPSLTPPTISETVPQTPKPKRRLGRKLPIVILALLILLGGGAAAVYVGYIVPNNPDKVVAKAFQKLATADPASTSFDVTSSTVPKAESSGKYTVNLLAGADSDLNIRADTIYNVSAFKLSLSTIVRTKEKTLYLKIDELPSLLKLASGGQSNPALAKFGAKLDNSWIRLNVKDLQTAGILTKAQAVKAQTCVSALSDYFTTQRGSLQNSLADAYKQHPFAKATKAGSETVNNISATKYSLAIDKTKSAAFAKSMNDALAKNGNSLDKACGSDSSTPAKSDSAAQNSTVHDTTVWIASDKSVTRLSTGVTSKGAETTVTINFGHQQLDTSVPAKVLTISDLQKEFEKAFGASLSDIKNSYTQGTIQ